MGRRKGNLPAEPEALDYVKRLAPTSGALIIFTPAKFSEVRWLVAPLKGGQGIGNLSPDGRNTSSAIVAAKAFLFVCRVGLRYTENERPVNWFAGVGQAVLKRAWAGVGQDLLRVLSNFLRVAWCV